MRIAAATATSGGDQLLEALARSELTAASCRGDGPGELAGDQLRIAAPIAAGDQLREALADQLREALADQLREVVADQLRGALPWRIAGVDRRPRARRARAAPRAHRARTRPGPRRTHR